MPWKTKQKRKVVTENDDGPASCKVTKEDSVEAATASDAASSEKDSEYFSKATTADEASGDSAENTAGTADKLQYADYDVSCEELAKSLLGQKLVRMENGKRMSGIIVETEAYMGPIDKAAHSHKGRSARNEAMFMAPGTAYVYNIYGIHCCMNVSAQGDGAAVLIRALQPTDNLEIMDKLRTKEKSSSFLKNDGKGLCNGPSKLCQALGITKNEVNKVDLCTSKLIWIEKADGIATDARVECKRINIDYAKEWADKPLRFYILDNKFVSVGDKAVEADMPWKTKQKRKVVTENDDGPASCKVTKEDSVEAATASDAASSEKDSEYFSKPTTADEASRDSGAKGAGTDDKLQYPDYDVSCEELAKSLLGQKLVRMENGKRMSGIIVETEAYLGPIDKAAHSHKGRSAQNEAMFMAPGTAYVYSNYGIHCCMNVSAQGDGAAVLLRALQPTDNLEIMDKLRTKEKSSSFLTNDGKGLCNGPSKLCQALGITKNEVNKVDLCTSKLIWIEKADGVATDARVECKRINIDSAKEWVDKPLRFYILGNKFVSVRDKAVEAGLTAS